MTAKLFVQAIGKFLFGLVLIGLLLFLPAWSLKYWNGWLFLCILFVPMFIAGIVMMFKNPELLKKRLNAKEEEQEQKTVIALSGLMFLAAYLMYAEVLRENTYLSRTVEVQENQKVIDTGLYGIVRHPMYSATLFLFLSMGIVLGSPISVAILLLYIPIIALRMKNEEQVLEKGLDGYKAYKTRVRYKVIPFIW